MNILILTGRFGMGHYTATTAIKEQITSYMSDANVQIIDIFDYLLPLISNTIYSGFNCLVKTNSTIYNKMCKASQNYSSVPFKRAFIKKLDKLFSEYNPDVIISTVPISSQYISAYKDFRNLNIPLFTYITDLFTHAEWLAKNTDLYFVGTSEFKSVLVNKGISPEQIRVSGIPVRRCFKVNDSNPNKGTSKNILIMGGGLGLMPFADSLYASLSKEPSLNVTIITGKNNDLYSSLKKTYPQFTILQYTDNVVDYMVASDLLISKAGGITIFEAIYTKTPLFIINPFLLQEIYNAKYIDQSQLGVVSWDNEDIMDKIMNLLNNEEQLNLCKNNMKALKEELDDNAIIKELILRKDIFNECYNDNNCTRNC